MRYLEWLPCALLLLLSSAACGDEWLMPVRVQDRTDASQLQLTQIGAYGIRRKARPGIPVHFHTGIDIRRPGGNYVNEPVLPACAGKVISIRNDGPFAQVIIEHGGGLWTVYEHVAGITCRVGDIADPQVPIARFFSTAELNRYGWQFDHFHFEVMKARPVAVMSDRMHPERFYATYALSCHDEDSLSERYVNPLEFLRRRQNEAAEKGVTR